MELDKDGKSCVKPLKTTLILNYLPNITLYNGLNPQPTLLIAWNLAGLAAHPMANFQLSPRCLST